MKLNRNIFYMAMAIIFGLVSSCSSTKYLPKDEVLYTGADVKVSHPRDDGRKTKDLRNELESLVRPQPNKKFLGMRIKLFIYNIAGKPKRENSLLGKLKYRTGEPPVLLSSLNLEYNNEVLNSHLENQGYFHARVEGDTVIRHRKARAVFVVETGPRYRIREVLFDKDSSELSAQINKTTDATLLKPGKHYDLEVVKAERNRIDVILKENGFYYFNPDYLIIHADSTIGNNEVILYVKVKPETPQKARLPYIIRDVYIFTNYSLRGQNEDTLKSRAVLLNGNRIVDRRNLYKPRMFDKMILFDPGDLYKRTEHNQTINRLISLGLFKFVKNRFEDSDSAGVPALDSYYYLTPFPKKSLRVELDANSKSNNLVGSNLGISWRNRNTFRGGELLTVSASGGFELQYSGQFRGYNTFRGGLETTLSIPRFIIPFLDLNTSSGFVPKTNMMVAYDILNRQKLYTMNSLRATYGYVWKESIRKEHQLNILSFNFVQPIAITQEFTDSSKNNPTLQKAVEKQFIIGSTYSFTYSPFVGAVNSSGLYFNGTLDLSGNIPGLLSGADAKGGKTSKIFNAVFSQYIKAQADVRYYMKTGNNAFWVNRFVAGYGLPYGNSTALPFIKQFFAGGNNSIRAFRSRSVGPGSYFPPNYGKNNFYAEQSGDIKLEFNTEYRAKLFSVVHGAAFVDAGNIWLKNEDTLKPGARFSSNFLNEIAVGAGLGIRIDVSFLVLRLDVAFPLRKPWLPEGDRWVLDQIRFGDKAWRSENLVYNLAIGYPF